MASELHVHSTFSKQSNRFRHGMSNTKIHWLWCKIRQRCNNPNCSDYHKYGQRGIKVCKEWDDSFESFYSWALEHGYKDGLTIDRKDNDGDYCPENCWFTDNKHQSNNRRSNNLIEIDGVSKTIQQWCDETGTSRGLFRSKLRRGIAGKELIDGTKKVNQYV